MATNPYFAKDWKGEQNLVQDLIIESIQMFGFDVYYIPRESEAVDDIWKDDVLRKYDDAYKMEMYIENTENFDGEGDLFAKFGIELRDAATFVMARRRWQEEVEGKRTDGEWYRPREGDLIYLPLSESMFQIHRVETESPFYQLGDLPVFRLSCELFEYSGEDFDTGVGDIDRVEKVFSYQYKLTMGDSAEGYQEGEEITQLLGSGATMRGEVVGWFDSSNELFIAHAGADDGQYHDFITGVDVVGSSSSASYQPTLVEQLQNVQDTSQAEEFQSEAFDFLDFTESNPFGDPF